VDKLQYHLLGQSGKIPGVIVFIWASFM